VFKIGFLSLAALLLSNHPISAKDLMKTALTEVIAPSCNNIAQDDVPEEVTTKTTQYFTPMFEPGADGLLQDKDRYNCVEMEGSCVVGGYLYDSSGQKYNRANIKYKFGMGSGGGKYNKTNSLHPCHTLAADPSIYPTGTVIYIEAFAGKTCPQTGNPVNGCFVVGDVGHAIKGHGRFDIFTGECAQYDGNKHVCLDVGNAKFNVPVGTTFRVFQRDSYQAKQLRSEFDSFIDNGWKP